MTETTTETVTVTYTDDDLLFGDDALAALELVAAGVPVDLAFAAAKTGVLYGDDAIAACLAMTAAAVAAEAE